MASNILESITAQYHSLTRSGKKLADYIFAHTGEAQYFSISTLAENSGVSEASITRFCHGLGLAGYNDFKLALAKTDHVTDMGELSDSPQGIASEDSLNTIFQKIHKASVLSLNETLELLNEDAINKAVDLLVQAAPGFLLWKRRQHGNGYGGVGTFFHSYLTFCPCFGLPYADYEHRTCHFPGCAPGILLLRLHQGYGGYPADCQGTWGFHYPGDPLSQFKGCPVCRCGASLRIQ